MFSFRCVGKRGVFSVPSESVAVLAPICEYRPLSAMFRRLYVASPAWLQKTKQNNNKKKTILRDDLVSPSSVPRLCFSEGQFCSPALNYTQNKHFLFCRPISTLPYGPFGYPIWHKEITAPQCLPPPSLVFETRGLKN